jgi:hypothetical protein
MNRDQKRTLRRAAALLEADARSLFECHSINGEWGGGGSNEARRAHNECVRIAAALRDMASGS